MDESGVGKRPLVRGSPQSTGVCETTREKREGVTIRGVGAATEKLGSAIPGPGIDSGRPCSFIPRGRTAAGRQGTGHGRMLITTGASLSKDGRRS